MKNIVFVCTGNTCRSPMAEGIFNAAAAEQGLDARASSCGIFAGTSHGASPHAVKAARDYGADIEAHLSRRLTSDILDAADKVYCATVGHLEYLQKMFPEQTGKLELMAEKDIDDPFSESLNCYEKIAAQINYSVLKIIDRLLRENE